MTARRSGPGAGHSAERSARRVSGGVSSRFSHGIFHGFSVGCSRPFFGPLLSTFSRHFGGSVAAAVLASALLAGCGSLATTPAGEGAPVPTASAAAGSFSLAARFSLRVEERNHSGRLDWRHTPARDEWLLSSPFGQGLAEIVSTADAACLAGSDGRRECDASLDALTQRVLGYPLPLADLADWVRGRGGDAASVDALGRPLSLERAGWHIDLAYDSDLASDAAGDALPRRLSIARPGGPELRLVIDAWGVPVGVGELPAAVGEDSPALALPVAPAGDVLASPLPAAGNAAAASDQH